MDAALDVAVPPWTTGVESLQYRRITPPPNYRGMKTVSSWIKWIDDERLFPIAAPAPAPACGFCCGAVGYMDDGEPFEMCPPCRRFRHVLDVFVPIAYSMPDGLESALHRHKDFAGNRWLGVPLACVLYEFLRRHLGCIEERVGTIDVAAAVPSGSNTRTFDHIENIIKRLDHWPVAWDLTLLEKVKEGRPPRREADDSFYAVSAGSDIDGKSVLLFDDTWTSGASMASAAAALQRAGARTVAGITLGRQLGPGFGSSDELIEIAHERRLRLDRCVLCE